MTTHTDSDKLVPSTDRGRRCATSWTGRIPSRALAAHSRHSFRHATRACDFRWGRSPVYATKAVPR
jgi:hypothetical protein